MKRRLSVFTAFLIVFAQIPFGALTVQAAVTDWGKGVSIQPTSTTDFSSSSFDQSLQNVKATGANYVSLIVPYYQSNDTSSDIQAGYNTPTDASLAAAIDYAHSIGLAVAINIHNESYTGDWRADISPSDRNAWFANFNTELQHVGTIAQAHHAEMIVMGTEMVSVASSKINGDNTQRWQTLIVNLRKIYTGKLTYDANSTNNNSDPFEDEKESVGFWSSLDYAGLSVYYNLNTGDNSVASLSNQWNYWNTNDLKAFQQRVGKQLFFTEVGYKSVDGAHLAPWDSGRGGGYNPTEQVNDYEAFLSYWNGFPYVAGVFWWNWDSNPSAGGSGNTDYTVQNKPALQTMTKWFTNPSSPGTTPPPSAPPAITASASSNPASPAANSAATITATAKNTGSTLSNAIVDVEVYNSANTRVSQQFLSNQSIAASATQNFTTNWSGGAAGQYRVAVGVFNSDWSQNYAWNDSAATITVSAATTPPPNNPPPPTTPPVTTNTNIWWPSSGSSVSGVQPFKANIDGYDVSQYAMYWQVDGGALNAMGNSTTDYPHKESDVDLSSWHWSSNHQYTLTFVSKDMSGKVISQKSEVITVQ
jgi:hypothetical protein